MPPLAMFNPCQPCCVGGECCPTWGPVLYGIFYPNDRQDLPLQYFKEPAPDYPPIYFIVNKKPGSNHWTGSFVHNWQQAGNSNFDVDLVCSPTSLLKGTAGYVINVSRNNQPFISGSPIVNYYTGCTDEFNAMVGDMWGYPPNNALTYGTSNLWLGPKFYPRKLIQRSNRKLIAEILDWSKSPDFPPPDNDLTGQHIILTWSYKQYSPYGFTIGYYYGMIPYSQHYLGTTTQNLYIYASDDLLFHINLANPDMSFAYFGPGNSYVAYPAYQLGFLYYLEANLPIVYNQDSTRLTVHLRVRDPDLQLTLNGGFTDSANFTCASFNNINKLTADPVHGDWTYTDGTYYATFYAMDTDINGNYGIRCDFGIVNTTCVVSYVLPMSPYDYDPQNTYTLPLLSNGNATCSCTVIPDSITISPIWP
jgi:hypothetical protein